MASVAVTNTFANNTTADGSQVNTNFSDLVTYINNRNSGAANWDLLSVLSASAVPFVADNSTGTSNIADFKDNGAIVFSVVDGGYCRFANGTAALPSISFLNNTNTGLYRVGVNDIAITVNGVMHTDFTTSGIFTLNGSVAAPAYSFQGDVNTGMYWVVADQLGFAVGGLLRGLFTTSEVDFGDTTGNFVNAQYSGTIQFLPRPDNIWSLGNASFRWTAVYAVNGTIQTSHSSTKTNIKEFEQNDLPVPRCITFQRPDDESRKTYLGFEADFLPQEAFVDDKNIYTSSVIGILCAHVKCLKKRIELIEATMGGRNGK